MTQAEDMVAQIEALGEKLAEAKKSITNRFIGQDRVVELTLTALLCGGHGLLIGLPGLGKTRLVETLSTVMGLHGSRVQFTWGQRCWKPRRMAAGLSDSSRGRYFVS
jgi:MoxR-like ATPase